MLEIRPILIVEYRMENNRIPFRAWLDSIKDAKTRQKVDVRLARLALGVMGDCKFFDNILELRIDYGPGYRIYCGKKGDAWIILLTGGSKRSQDADIAKAKKYWADYERRGSS